MLSPWPGILNERWEGGGVQKNRSFPATQMQMQTIYSGVSAIYKKGSQHSPWCLVLFPSVLQEGGLIQSLGCRSLANLILSRILYCKHAVYCQAGPKSDQTWEVKWGHMVPFLAYLNTLPFVYTDTLCKCVIFMILGENTKTKYIWGQNVLLSKKKKEWKRNVLTSGTKAKQQSFLR